MKKAVEFFKDVSYNRRLIWRGSVILVKGDHRKGSIESTRDLSAKELQMFSDMYKFIVVGDFEEPKAEEPEEPEIVPEAKQETEQKPAVTAEINGVTFTPEKLASLHEEKGSWTKVADALEVSTTTLRKHRDTLGV